MKSGPTSGPLTVSSQVTQAPHGIWPPEQFIIVPLRLVKDRITSPCLVTWMVVVPPPALASYGVPEANRRTARGRDVVTSWLRTSTHGAAGPVERAHAVVAAGQGGAVREDDRLLGVVERAVVEPLGQVQPDHAVALVADRHQAGLAGWLARLGGRGHQAGERAGGSDGGSGLEDGTTVDGHARSLPEVWSPSH